MRGGMNLMESSKYCPEEEYSRRIEKYTRALNKEMRLYNLLSNLRIVVFFVGVGLSIYLFLVRYYLFSGILFPVTIILFVYLIIQHGKIQAVTEELSRLIEINQASIKRITGEWTQFTDMGEEFIDPEHQYSIDLDIFGKASLFQWVNVTSTYLGRRKLTNILTKISEDKDQILCRQSAIKELADNLDWRQSFQAEGMGFKGVSRNPEGLLKWTGMDNELLNKPGLILILQILPIITTIAVLVYLVIPGVHYLVAAIPVLIQAVLLWLGKKLIIEVVESTGKYKKETRIYQGLFRLLEKAEFTNDLLTDLQIKLFDDRGRLASHQVSKLGKIVENMDLRYVPMFHVLLNLLVMWDYQCIIALERWKERSGKYFHQWLQAVADVEALSSLAVICYDHKEWVFPEIVTDGQIFKASDLGHPLIPDSSRVCNDLELNQQRNILIITGSNMSGKSTLLRTVGINLVLAFAGAPVCAQKLQCSMMGIYSSMRVNDSLEQNISSFYAELLRVKMIVDASRKSKPMIFLLDEIFRGTNSKDRHLGAITVLKKMNKKGIIGLVSTHDLELGELEKESSLQVRNYHFEESYQDNEIHFDYQLKPGVSTTTNAIYLMKMVGIDMVKES